MSNLKLNRPKHFCYLPTRKLCELDSKLDDLYFPENYEDVIKQELVTYFNHPDGLKKVTFSRTFTSNGRHIDNTSSEIFVTKDKA